MNKDQIVHLADAACRKNLVQPLSQHHFQTDDALDNGKSQFTNARVFKAIPAYRHALISIEVFVNTRCRLPLMISTK